MNYLKSFGIRVSIAQSDKLNNNMCRINEPPWRLLLHVSTNILHSPDITNQSHVCDSFHQHVLPSSHHVLVVGSTPRAGNNHKAGKQWNNRISFIWPVFLPRILSSKVSDTCTVVGNYCRRDCSLEVRCCRRASVRFYLHYANRRFASASRSAVLTKVAQTAPQQTHGDEECALPERKRSDRPQPERRRQLCFTI